MLTPLSSWLQKAQSRGEAYTAFDAIKLFAIISMTADHIGYYFFPEAIWWRVFGRLCVPIWFFFVGYSRSRPVNKELWIYAILLLISEPFTGGSIFPVTVLFTIIACRILLNLCEDLQFFPSKLPEIIAVSFFLSFFTIPLTEYGSAGFLLAVFGRMVRTKQTPYFLTLMLSSYMLFVMWQCAVFSFNQPQAFVMMLGTGAIMLWLSQGNNPVIWPQWAHSRWKTCVTVLSRNTIPYYFYHRIVFEIVATLLLGQGFHFVLRSGLIFNSGR